VERATLTLVGRLSRGCWPGSCPIPCGPATYRCLSETAAATEWCDIILSVPNFDTPVSPARQAMRVLFALGMHLPVGVPSPFRCGCARRQRRALTRRRASASDGRWPPSRVWTVALVAENPELRDEPLSAPATTVAAAAEARRLRTQSASHRCARAAASRIPPSMVAVPQRGMP
jgi:hypothetical protein